MTDNLSDRESCLGCRIADPLTQTAAEQLRITREVSTGASPPDRIWEIAFRCRML
jgi:hypothetical protein